MTWNDRGSAPKGMAPVVATRTPAKASAMVTSPAMTRPADRREGAVSASSAPSTMGTASQWKNGVGMAGKDRMDLGAPLVVSGAGSSYVRSVCSGMAPALPVFSSPRPGDSR